MILTALTTATLLAAASSTADDQRIALVVEVASPVAPSDIAKPPAGTVAASPPIVATTPSEVVPQPTAADSPDDAAAEEITVTGRPSAPPGDPLENINAQSFEITQDVDEALIGPVSLAYGKVIPRPIRSGLRNVLSNLSEPVVFLNFLLQLKPGKAAETFGRFAINSTLGGAGLFDVAKRPAFKLPRRPNGFGYTLGYYGVRPGAFLYLPLVGPTTVRDLFGGGLDRLVLPTLVGAPFNDPTYGATTGGASSLDRRIEIDARLRDLRQNSDDPYSTLREQYLQRRQAVIDELRGRTPQVTGGDPVQSVVAAPTEPATPTAPAPASDEDPAAPTVD